MLLRPGESLKKKRAMEDDKGLESGLAPADSINSNQTARVGAHAAVQSALMKRSGASTTGSLVLKTPKDARHLVK